MDLLRSTRPECCEEIGQETILRSYMAKWCSLRPFQSLDKDSCLEALIVPAAFELFVVMGKDDTSRSGPCMKAQDTGDTQSLSLSSPLLFSDNGKLGRSPCILFLNLTSPRIRECVRSVHSLRLTSVIDAAFLVSCRSV
jgi:hypothetical protein